MIQKNKFNLLVCALSMTLAFNSCNKSEDMYDSSALQNDAKASYSKNFQAKYPNVDLNQDWDLSCQSSEFNLGSTTQASRMMTRAGETGYTMTKRDTLYEVDNDVVKWLQAKFPGTDARANGRPFYMRVPSSNFSIIPIFQNKANGIWDLHMVVDGEDILVWHKSEDMYIKKVGSNEWTALLDIPQQQSGSVLKDNTRNTLAGTATAVKGPEFYFSGMPVGKEISFYLEITATTSKVHDVGDKIGSLIGNMVSVPLAKDEEGGCPWPKNIDENKEVSFIACEDGKAGRCDWSLNDVIFMVVGDPDIPSTVELTDGTPIVEKRTVRYLMEDLGATDDFDFNDIVVDVEQSRTTTPVMQTITDKLGNKIEWLTGWKNTAYTQKATVRHLGGQLPFKLQIGDTEISDIAPKMDSNPDKEYTVTGWDPDTHNVSIQVKQSQSNGMLYNNIAFPKTGEVPMIIAVNPNQAWMEERVSIPETWFVDNRTDD